MRGLNEDFHRTASKCFLYVDDENRSNVFRETYFPYEVIDTRAFEDLGHLFSDSIIGYPTHLFVNLTSKFVDVFYYRFSYIGNFSLFNYPRDSPYSVAHGDDIHYLVPWTFLRPVEIDHLDNFIVERLLSIYENFARTGYVCCSTFFCFRN